MRLGRDQREREALARALRRRPRRAGRRTATGRARPLQAARRAARACRGGAEAALRVRHGPLAEVDLRQPRSRSSASADAGGRRRAALASISSSALARSTGRRAPGGAASRRKISVFGFASPTRRDRRLVVGHVVVAPREDDVEVLELGGGRQHHVGERGGVGHELLEHDGEQVLAAQAVQHALLVGRDRRRVRVPARPARLTGGSSAGSVSASPSWDMLIVRTGPGRRSARSSGARRTAPRVAVGMYEQPPPTSRQAPASAGRHAIVR